MVGYPLHGAPGATSLLDQPGMGIVPGAGPEPPLGDLLETAMEIPEVSRLPLRDD